MGMRSDDTWDYSVLMAWSRWWGSSPSKATHSHGWRVDIGWWLGTSIPLPLGLTTRLLECPLDMALASPRASDPQSKLRAGMLFIPQPWKSHIVTNILLATHWPALFIMGGDDKKGVTTRGQGSFGDHLEGKLPHRLCIMPGENKVNKGNRSAPSGADTLVAETDSSSSVKDLFTNSATQQIFTKSRLCIGLCARPWGYSHDKNGHSPA